MTDDQEQEIVSLTKAVQKTIAERERAYADCASRHRTLIAVRRLVAHIDPVPCERTDCPACVIDWSLKPKHDGTDRGTVDGERRVLSVLRDVGGHREWEWKCLDCANGERVSNHLSAVARHAQRHVHDTHHTVEVAALSNSIRLAGEETHP